MASVLERIRQAAAIPVMGGQVCVITSSSGKRWVIPKGCYEPGKTAQEIAMQEAWEEAGLLGHLYAVPVGNYSYKKWDTICDVTVFVMEVTQIADQWPEQGLRQRLWLKPNKAIARVSDPGLRRILHRVLAGNRMIVGA